VMSFYFSNKNKQIGTSLEKNRDCETHITTKKRDCKTREIQQKFCETMGL